MSELYTQPLKSDLISMGCTSQPSRAQRTNIKRVSTKFIERTPVLDKQRLENQPLQLELLLVP